MKIRIVPEGFRREVTVNDLCRREGIKPHSYYAWTKEFMEAGKERLTPDMARDATRQEIHALKRENGELKQLVASDATQSWQGVPPKDYRSSPDVSHRRLVLQGDRVGVLLHGHGDG